MNNSQIKKITILLFFGVFLVSHPIYAEKVFHEGVYYGDRGPDGKITIVSPADAPRSENAKAIDNMQQTSGMYAPNGKGTPTSASSTTNTDTTTPADPMDQAAAQALEGQPSYDEAAAENAQALEDATNTQGNNSASQDTSTDNLLGISNDDLRNGNVNMDTIPKVIINIINILLGIAGTISILSLIYYAFQMQINSGITGDSSGVDKAKKGMIGSIIGFVIAICAWFIIIKAIEILTSLGGS